jgi:hypothetical protein
MTPRQAEQLLNEFTSSLASSVGFNRMDDDFFGRPEHDALGLLSFPFHVSARDSALFTLWVGLRFEPFARWVHEYPNEIGPTLARPIHFLREDRTFTEWEFASAEELERLRSVILTDLREYAVPFIEHYSRLANLRKALESPNKQDWFDAGLDVDRRVVVLAAIQLVDGDRAGAIKTLEDGLRVLDETLADRPHQLRKRRFDLEYLRKRILRSD